MKNINVDEFCIDDVLKNAKEFKKKDKDKDKKKKKKKKSEDEKVVAQVAKEIKKKKIP